MEAASSAAGPAPILNRAVIEAKTQVHPCMPTDFKEEMAEHITTDPSTVVTGFNSDDADLANYYGLAGIILNLKIQLLSEEDEEKVKKEATIACNNNAISALTSRDLGAVNAFFEYFAQLCALEEIDHLDHSKLSIQNARLLSSLFIIRIIINQPQKTRGPNYSSKQVANVLDILFSESLEIPFYTIVKDLLPKDDSEKSKLVNKVAFFLNSVSSIPLKFHWLVHSQTIKLADIVKANADEGQKQTAVTQYCLIAQEHTFAEVFKDHDIQASFACDLFLESNATLTPELDTLQIQLEAAVTNFVRVVEKPIAGGAGEKMTSDSSTTVGSMNLLHRHLTHTYPAEIRRGMRDVKHLRVRIRVLSQLAKDLNLAESKPLYRKILQLSNRCHNTSESLRQKTETLICFLSEQIGPIELPFYSKFQENFAHELIKLHTIEFHTLVYDTMLLLINRENKGTQLTEKEIKSLYFASIGHVCQAVKLHQSSETKIYYSSAKKHPIKKHNSTLKKRGKVLLQNYLDTYKSQLTGGNEILLKIINTMRPENMIQTVSSILHCELNNGNHSQDIEEVLISLRTNQKKMTQENVIGCLRAQMHLKTAGIKGHEATPTTFIKNYINIMTQINKRRIQGSETGIESMLYSSDLRDKLAECHSLIRSLGILSVNSCAILTRLVHPVFPMPTLEVVDEDEIPLSELEILQTKERKKLSTIVFEELMMEEEAATHVNEIDPLSIEIDPASPPPPQASKTEKATAILSSEVSPPATAVLSSEVSPTAACLPSYQPHHAHVVLGKIRVAASDACKAQEQIYFHQALTIISTLIINPELASALQLSLLESIHLTLEQAVTGIAPPQDFTTHKLLDRFRKCGFTPLCGKAIRITEAGTYNARYPSMNVHTMRSESLTAQILREVSDSGTIPAVVLLELLNKLNSLMAEIHGLPIPHSLKLGSLKGFVHQDNPIACTQIKLQPQEIIDKIKTKFPDSSNEKEDLIAHLQELQAIIAMINNEKGVRKELSGIIVHTIFRIRQYSTKNLMVLKYCEIQGDDLDLEMIPSRHSDLAHELQVEASLANMITHCNMQKGLDYPLSKRNQRPLTENEHILVSTHLQSMVEVGYSMPGADSEFDPVDIIIKTMDETCALLTKLLD